MSSLYLCRLGCLFLLAVSPAIGRRVVTKDAELQRQNQTGGTRVNASGNDWLELDMNTYQKPNTYACWALSVIEGLRYQGHLAKLFSSGTIGATCSKCGADGMSVTWQTPKGNGKKMKSGKFDIYNWVYASWQQVIEEIWAENLMAVGGGKFQKKMADAPKGGGPARAEQLTKFFQTIDKNIRVQGEMIGIHGSTQFSKLRELFTPSVSGPGTATVWQLDKTPGKGKAGQHAIAVHDVKIKSSRVDVGIYNQQSERGGTYSIEAKQDGCQSAQGNYCDAVFKYTITGLPA